MCNLYKIDIIVKKKHALILRHDISNIFLDLVRIVLSEH